MKVLVTGGAGFVGSNLSSFLADKGAKVTILDNFSPGAIENIKDLEADLVEGRVENAGLVNSLKGKSFDFIHHQAAITDTTVDDQERMMRVNVEGFKNILNLAQKENSKVIYASSAGVYGDGPVPMRESQKPAPLNAYALSKIRADELALAFAKENQDMKITGLRYFNVYGPGEKHKRKSASMIWQLAGQMKQGKNPRIFKWGEQERDFIYVKDVVEAIIKAMEAKESCIVNIGTGQATNFNRIIEILNEILGTNFKPEYFDSLYDFYQNQTQADTALAAHLLGFKARFSIEKGMGDYFAKEEKQTLP